MGLGAWLFRDQLLQRIDADVDMVIGFKKGMTPDERQVGIAALEGELLDLERLDAEMMWLAIAQGLAITPRGLRNPRAALDRAYHRTRAAVAIVGRGRLRRGRRSLASAWLDACRYARRLGHG